MVFATRDHPVQAQIAGRVLVAVARRKLVDFSSTSSSLSKSANFQWMQRRRESWMFTRRQAVKSGPTWRIHGKQKTVATGGDVKREGTGEVEKGTEGNEENRRRGERERERREGRRGEGRRRRKRIRIFTNHSARHLREGKSPLPLKSEEVERFIESWNT